LSDWPERGCAGTQRAPPSPEDPCCEHSASGSQRSLHLLIDSAEIKLAGEGAWSTRKRGGTKRRVWHKVQLGIDKQTLEIRAVEATSSDVVDGPTVCDKARGRAVQGLGGRGV
jgi:hypothetical protein